jgi:putative transcriptional regulator
MKTKESTITASLLEGLNQAVEYSKGNLQAAKKRKVIISPLPKYQPHEIKQIRNSLHLTQRIFADIIGVSVKAVEAWEAGTNTPNGPTTRILQLLQSDPKLLEHHNILVTQ